MIKLETSLIKTYLSRLSFNVPGFCPVKPSDGSFQLSLRFSEFLRVTQTVVVSESPARANLSPTSLEL
jgi:hypothetical protein